MAISEIPSLNMPPKNRDILHFNRSCCVKYVEIFERFLIVMSLVLKTRRNIILCSAELNKDPFSYRLIYGLICRTCNNCCVKSSWKIQIGSSLLMAFIKKKIIMIKNMMINS